jgi:endonuclease YncB( thermonuclease family)
MDGYKIRLLGVDAPEIRQVCQTTEGYNWPCGIMARDVLQSMLESQSQELVCQLDGKDRYKRDLGSCFIGSVQTGIDVQKMLIRAGLAVAEYGDQYKVDEQYAANEKRGMWVGDFLRPKEWRKKQKDN